MASVIRRALDRAAAAAVAAVHSYPIHVVEVAKAKRELGVAMAGDVTGADLERAHRIAAALERLAALDAIRLSAVPDAHADGQLVATLAEDPELHEDLRSQRFVLDVISDDTTDPGARRWLRRWGRA